MQLAKLAGTAVISLTLIAACGGPAATIGPGATSGPITTAAPNATPTPPPAAATNPPVGGTIDVCSLLTPAELTAALGETYVAGVPNEFGLCLWNIEGETGNTGSLVQAYIDPQAYSFLHSVMGIQTGVIELTVSGHAAFYNPLEFYNSLWVDIGGAGTFILGFPRSGDLDPSFQAIAVQLAEIALSRM